MKFLVIASTAPLQSHSHDPAIVFKLVEMAGAIKLTRSGRPGNKSFAAAFRVAAFDLAMAFRVVVANVFSWVERFQILGVIVRMVMILVVDVVKLAVLTVAYWNRAVSVEIGRLMGEQSFTVNSPVFPFSPSRLFVSNEKRITMSSQPLIVHGAPTPAERGIVAGFARYALIFPCSFSRHKLDFDC